MAHNLFINNTIFLKIVSSPFPQHLPHSKQSTSKCRLERKRKKERKKERKKVREREKERERERERERKRERKREREHHNLEN